VILDDFFFFSFDKIMESLKEKLDDNKVEEDISSTLDTLDFGAGLSQ
jgi:hypothetical protein